MPAKILTQQEIKSLLDYNDKTGVFVWKVRRGGTAIVGSVAGSKSGADYQQISINDYPYLAHRLAWVYMYGEWPEEVDHKDHDKGNNKINNLRRVSHSVNGKNQSFSKNNTSGVTGVYFDGRYSSWYAKIQVGGRHKHLGSFRKKSDAVGARLAAERRYKFHENHGRSR